MNRTPPIELATIFLVLMTGFTWYIIKASRASTRRPTVFDFFLGGRHVGLDLTKHSNWGLGFSFSNGLWFCAVLAYKFGLWVIPIQAIWSLSVICLGLCARHILSATRTGDTIHGFIGKQYQPVSRVMASIATTIGYFLNCGFELYFSALIFAYTLGYPELVMPIAILLALLCGSYCMIGGYRANAMTDKPQNIIGMLACAAVVLLFAQAVLGSEGAAAAPSPVGLASRLPPTDLLIGLSVFLALFNLVDMANWQMVASNGEIPKEEQAKLYVPFMKSALYQMAFPTVAGAIIGWLLQATTGLADETLLPTALSSVFVGAPELLRGMVLGTILLGFLSCTLSSSDTYLLAAAHTVTVDLVGHRQYERIITATSMEERLALEAQFIRTTRLFLIPLALAMVFFFTFCYRFWPGSVFQFQFIMYGSALALVPAAGYALYTQNTGRRIRRSLAPWATASIVSGILAGIAPYLLIRALLNADLSFYSPVFVTLISSVVFGIGLAIAPREVDAETHSIPAPILTK